MPKITYTDDAGVTTVFVPEGVSPPSPPPPQPPITNGIKLDGVRLAGIENAIFDVSGPEGTSAIHVTGANCSVKKVEQLGTSMALTMSGAKNLLCDGLKCVNGKLTDKGIYSGGMLSDGVTIKNVELVIPLGAEHGIRFHGWKNFTLANVRVTYLNSVYKGAALTVKEGENFTIRDSRLDGPVGFENLPVNFNKPGADTWRCKNILIERCEINTPGYLVFNSGVENVEVNDCLIRGIGWPAAGATEYDLTPKSTILDLKGARGPWPAPTGVFSNCEFWGLNLLSSVSKANIANWRFQNCTFNGHRVNERGEV